MHCFGTYTDYGGARRPTTTIFGSQHKGRVLTADGMPVVVSVYRVQRMCTREIDDRSTNAKKNEYRSNCHFSRPSPVKKRKIRRNVLCGGITEFKTRNGCKSDAYVKSGKRKRKSHVATCTNDSRSLGEFIVCLTAIFGSKPLVEIDRVHGDQLSKFV